jgi:hypothetical protein
VNNRTARPPRSRRPSLRDADQLEVLLGAADDAASAGQLCPVVDVPELAAGLGLGLAARTLATPHVLNAPATMTAATAALTRDRLWIALCAPPSGLSTIGSMPYSFQVHLQWNYRTHPRSAA